MAKAATRCHFDHTNAAASISRTPFCFSPPSPTIAPAGGLPGADSAAASSSGPFGDGFSGTAASELADMVMAAARWLVLGSRFFRFCFFVPLFLERESRCSQDDRFLSQTLPEGGSLVQRWVVLQAYNLAERGLQTGPSLSTAPPFFPSLSFFFFKLSDTELVHRPVLASAKLGGGRAAERRGIFP